MKSLKQRLQVTRSGEGRLSGHLSQKEAGMLGNAGATGVQPKDGHLTERWQGTSSQSEELFGDQAWLCGKSVHARGSLEKVRMRRMEIFCLPAYTSLVPTVGLG